jgi:hypothetical protein
MRVLLIFLVVEFSLATLTTTAISHGFFFTFDPTWI